MFTSWNITIAHPGLIATLSAAERYRALNGLPSGGGLVWWILIASGLLTGAALLAVVVIRRRNAHHVDHAVFDAHATHRGLSAAERQCLLQLTKAAGVKQAHSVFTLPTVFGRGEHLLLSQIGDVGVSEPQRSAMRVHLAALREKLGFTGQSVNRGDRPALVDTLTKGSHLKGIKSDAGDVMDMIVSRVTAVELTVHATGQADLAPGQQWTLRYYHGPTIWEFDSTILSHDEKETVLHYRDEVRFVNRRRYLRTETVLPATISDYGFFKGDGNIKPQFTQAMVVEVGGPGLMLIETTYPADVDDKVLIAVKFRAHSVIQALAKVRWTDKTPSGLTTLGLELIGLSDQDLSTLIHESTLAQRSLASTDADRGEFRRGEAAVQQQGARI